MNMTVPFKSEITISLDRGPFSSIHNCRTYLTIAKRLKLAILEQTRSP